MKPKTRLILHIGTFKTGTTALQNVFATQDNYMRINHALYHGWQDDGFSMNHAFLASMLLFNGGQEIVSQYFTELLNKCECQGIKTALVSAEGFYCLEYADFEQLRIREAVNSEEFFQYRKEYVRNLYKCIGEKFEIKVAVYLRRQDYFFDSFYNQLIKGVFGYTKSLSDLVDSWGIIADYRAMLEIWAEIFGKENMIVRVYEKEQLPFGIEHDFFTHVMGFDYTQQAFTSAAEAPFRNNIRLTRDVLEFKRIINRFISELSFDERKQLRDDVTIVSSRLAGTGTAKMILSPPDRNKLLQHYSAGNQFIAKQYLSREDGCLFYEATPTDYSAYENYKGLSIESAIEIGRNLSLIENRRVSAQVKALEELLHQLSR